MMTCEHEKKNLPDWLRNCEGVNLICNECFEIGLHKPVVFSEELRITKSRVNWQEVSKRKSLEYYVSKIVSNSNLSKDE